MSPAPVVVGVVMGSSSDWDTLRTATEILAEFGIAFEARVVSAHRMPDDMFRYAEAAAGRGLKAIIAGAGGQQALAGSRLAAFHRADAERNSGRHLRHRQRRRGQCGAVRGGDAGA